MRVVGEGILGTSMRKEETCKERKYVVRRSRGPTFSLGYLLGIALVVLVIVLLILLIIDVID